MARPAVTLPPGELMYRWMSALASSRLQEQQLGDDGVGHLVVDLRAEEDDAVLQQAAVDVHRPLFAAALLDHVGNQGMDIVAAMDATSGVLHFFLVLGFDRLLGEDVVDEAVVLGLFGGHVEIAVGVLGDPLDRLAGVRRPGSR